MNQNFPKDTLPAFLNFLQAKYDAYTGAVTVKSTPYYAMVDPCDICQLRCPTCPTGIENEGIRSKAKSSNTNYRSVRSRLSPELFDALIEESGENLFRIDFHSWGEPLLNENTPSFIRKAKAYNIETTMHTNFSLKLSDERIEELLTSGLDYLIVSVDGFSQEAYEKFRIGGDVELVKENLVRVARIRDKLGLTTVIGYKFLVFEWNEHEMPVVAQFCEEHGLTFLRNESLVPDEQWLPSYRQEEKPFLSLVDVEELDRQWEAVGQPGYWREHEKHPYFMPVPVSQDWVATDGPAADSFCGWHYSVAVVQPGGQLAPCCIVEKESDRFGAVIPGEVPLVEVWNNENYRKSRAAFAGKVVEELEDVDTVCTRCYFPDVFKQGFNDSDAQVIGQYLEVFGDNQPVLAQAFRMLLEGESEAAQKKYAEYFEKEVATLLEDASRGQLQVARRSASDTASATPTAKTLTLDEAAEIAQDYMSQLNKIGVNGQAVYDESLLPNTKSIISQALLKLVKATADEEIKSTFKNGLMVLSFFQPNVGQTSEGLDQDGPAGSIWQDVINQEMQLTGVTLAEQV